MTLILTATNASYVLQVSDRLLTQDSREFDQFANKALIFFARDGIVSVGYSGLAYIRGEPTDHWLAEQISGERIGERGIRIGPLAQWSDVGTMILRLVRDLNRLPQAWRDSFGELVIAGWQWPKRRPTMPRQVLWTLQPFGRRGPYTAQQLVARHLPERERFNLFYVPAGTPVPDSEVAELGKRLVSYGPEGHDAAEQALVAEVRRVRTRVPTVGPHCMSILLSMRLGAPRVRYHPDGQHQLLLRPDTGLPVTFTPWIIGPEVIAPPTVAVGAAMARFGRVQVDIEAPSLPDDSPIVLFVHSQDRPTPPGWRPGIFSPTRGRQE